MRALGGLPSDSKTVMIANARRNGEARGIYYGAEKGPPVCLSVCLSDRLAGWLDGWQCICATAAVAAVARHNNRWLGS